ncbi:uncharacterized protein G2W53_030205 [Senna tora]|uniref:Uncharacterized protein n=1 Tax=Senna tora TaxID=362788 RepID=A0A834T731_9FABA|nr:uncharacterized protein G2W53_030205 [Senna tora]
MRIGGGGGDGVHLWRCRRLLHLCDTKYPSPNMGLFDNMSILWADKSGNEWLITVFSVALAFFCWACPLFEDPSASVVLSPF